MGTAQGIAEHLKAQLESAQHNVLLNNRYRPGDLSANPESIILICTSNTGMGDLPATIAPMLRDICMNNPDLRERRFGIINLGDSSYPNFAQAGQTLDEALTDMCATRIGTPLVLDAMEGGDYPSLAKIWLNDWLNALR